MSYDFEKLRSKLEASVPKGQFFKGYEVSGGAYKPLREIARNEQLNGGVYHILPKGEAISLSWDRGGAIKDLYDSIVNRNSKRLGEEDVRAGEKIDGAKILYDVFDAVRSRVWSDFGYGKMVGEQNSEKIVPISDVVAKGRGADRQINVVTAAILERMSAEGLIKGDVTLNSNIKLTSDGDWADGKVWVQVNSPSNGEKFVVDPANGYIGPLRNTWYERPF